MRVELKNFQYSEITWQSYGIHRTAVDTYIAILFLNCSFFNKIEQLNMIQKLQTTKPSFNLFPHPHLFSCYQGEISHQQRLLTVFFAHGHLLALKVSIVRLNRHFMHLNCIWKISYSFKGSPYRLSTLCKLDYNM